MNVGCHGNVCMCMGACGGVLPYLERGTEHGGDAVNMGSAGRVAHGQWLMGSAGRGDFDGGSCLTVGTAVGTMGGDFAEEGAFDAVLGYQSPPVMQTDPYILRCCKIIAELEACENCSGNFSKAGKSVGYSLSIK